MVIGSIDTREEMKTTVGTGVVTRGEDNTRITGENKIEVMEVRSCFLSEAWWLLFLPTALICKHFFLHTISVCFVSSSQ